MKIFKVIIIILFIALAFSASGAFAASRAVFPKDPRYQEPPAGVINNTFGSPNSESAAAPGADSSDEAVASAPEPAQNNLEVEKPFSFDAVSFIIWSIVFLSIIFFAIFIFSLIRLNKNR